MSKFYTVTKGYETGVFDTWSECETQIKGFSGAVFKSYKTRKEAENAFKYGIKKDIKTKQKEKIVYETDYIKNSISVDASCLNNPGKTEYKAVMTDTGDKLFGSKIYKSGTNNIGEFLALVKAMQYRKENNLDLPIYSDSDIGIGWVFKQHNGSNLALNNDTKEIYDDANLALEWLKENKDQYFGILKWETELWGQSKADFGRKS